MENMFTSKSLLQFLARDIQDLIVRKLNSHNVDKVITLIKLHQEFLFSTDAAPFGGEVLEIKKNQSPPRAWIQPQEIKAPPS